MPSPAKCLQSDDPLSRRVAEFLSTYAEEDNFVDYKRTIDITSDKFWLELTKDVSAFANTLGGYLVFGIDDEKKSIVGISNAVADVIRDVTKIQQKLNRHLEPHVSKLRSKVYRFGRKSVGFILIPQSKGRTHCVSENASFTQLSGEAKVVLRQGTFYVRRSGGNHLGDSRDLDEVIERRIDQFRESLLNKVAKVVNSPVSSDVYILSKDPNDATGERFVIEDSPDAIAVKGMSFTVAPEGPEEEIAAYTVLCRGNPDQWPRESVVWKWYADRKKIKIREAHRLAVFQFSLWCDAPSFFWIHGIKRPGIRKALLDTIRGRPASTSARHMMIVASFLGKGTDSAALKSIGDDVDRLAPSMKNFPASGPKATYAAITGGYKQTAVALHREKEARLDEIANNAKTKGRVPGRQNINDAQKIDCFLYSQDDKYT